MIILKKTFQMSCCFQLRVCEDTVCPLLSAGVMFQMPHIIKSCCTFLEHQLDPSEFSLIFLHAVLIFVSEEIGFNLLCFVAL